VTCLESIVELMGIVTVATARRRGYGMALTWAALAAGRVRDCTAQRRQWTYRTYLPPRLP
jgi:hypothetical protein